MRDLQTRRGVEYAEIPESDVPEGVVFDVPRVNQGQIVEVAYGDVVSQPWRGRGEFDVGDKYKRVVDRSDGETTYYIRVSRTRR